MLTIQNGLRMEEASKSIVRLVQAVAEPHRKSVFKTGLKSMECGIIGVTSELELSSAPTGEEPAFDLMIRIQFQHIKSHRINYMQFYTHNAPCQEKIGQRKSALITVLAT